MASYAAPPLNFHLRSSLKRPSACSSRRVLSFDQCAGDSYVYADSLCTYPRHLTGAASSGASAAHAHIATPAPGRTANKRHSFAATALTLNIVVLFVARTIDAVRSVNPITVGTDAETHHFSVLQIDT